MNFSNFQLLLCETLSLAIVADTVWPTQICKVLVSTISSENGEKYCRAFCDNASHASIALLVWWLRRALESESCVNTERSCFRESLGALASGSLLDLDHFLAARSFSLHAATHISPSPVYSGLRPPGHALLAVPIIALGTAITASCVSIMLDRVAPLESQAAHKPQTSSRDIRLDRVAPILTRVFCLVGTCLVSHQLRDSTRRGFWLWPLWRRRTDHDDDDLEPHDSAGVVGVERASLLVLPEYESLSTPPVPYLLYLVGLAALPVIAARVEGAIRAVLLPWGNCKGHRDRDTNPDLVV
jgi:hypothetical protein